MGRQRGVGRIMSTVHVGVTLIPCEMPSDWHVIFDLRGTRKDDARFTMRFMDLENETFGETIMTKAALKQLKIHDRRRILLANWVTMLADTSRTLSREF
jgi:hypothetical protein